MAEKYIDQKEAIQVIQDISNHYHKTYVSNARAETAEWCLKQLTDIPAADVVEVRHGRWTKELLFCKPVCSECGEPCIGLHGYDYELTNYCPNCGAKMDGDGR